MKKILYLAISAIITFNLCFLRVNGQEYHTKFRSTPLTTYDSLKLSELPPLVLPGEANRRLLPYTVDNSALPWFRPIFYQEGAECGQAASIGYVFTYEINCLRNLPANVPDNQYATWFSYNFITGGQQYVGVSYYETYEILKYTGNPTVTEYGGMSNGGVTRWMSGYDLYYNAMHNRPTEVYSIKANTPEGIQTMKNWVYDHGNGSTAGGVGCFYAALYSTSVFPPGVPEEGKFVIINWGYPASHAVSIVGYNDSIRWDYNSDGLYTNDVDINDDGKIDVRDWEIGGFKVANSYSDEWSDGGFAYMMYKSVAEIYGQGGIFNNSIVVIDVKDNYEPQLTAKVTLSHDCRNMLRITAGVAADPEAAEPEYIMHFPVFDFQGGCHPMQGDSSADAIEIGLDLNPLLNYINPGEQARFFLMIQEDDPAGSGSGTLESFSIIDYTNGVDEINSGVSALPIANNSFTTVSVNASVNYNPVAITTDTLPAIELYSNISTQLEAAGGTPPYRWHLADDYTRFDSTASMSIANADSVKLQPASIDDGKVLVNLPFSFPFYGKEYNEIWATVDGYLLFEDTEIPWPYFIEGRTYFIETPMIAAALCNPFTISDNSKGIWYEESGESVVFRWRMGVWGVPDAIFNATVRLFSDGKIEINYGECILPSFVERHTGISNGDGENYEIVTYDTDFTPSQNQLIIYTPTDLYSGIILTPDGSLNAECYQPMNAIPITVCVTDKYNIRDYKTLNLNTTGLQMEYEVMAGGDDKIEIGEEVYMNLVVTNHTNVAIGTTNFILETDDPFFTLTDDTAELDNIQPGETITIPNEITFIAGNDMPDKYEALFNLNASAAEGDWSRMINLTGFRPVLSAGYVTINELNNSVPDPGETIELLVDIHNSGGANLLNAVAILAASDPFVDIITPGIEFDTLAPDGNLSLAFQLAISSQAPLGHVINLQLEVSGEHEFSFNEPLYVSVGKAIETFEEGNFEWLHWESGGDAPWVIDTGNTLQGNVCARSGAITNNQTSMMKLYWDAAVDDSISFWYMVESQYYYDYLRFLTLEGEKGRWSGYTGWKRAAFPITAGPNMFTWVYKKNYNLASGQDCAWVDYIVFPPLNGTISTKQIDLNPPMLWVYPNPGNDRLVIKYSLPESSRAVISIFDIHGRCVFRNEENILPAGEYTLTPALGNLKAGAYTVSLHTNKGTTERKMIRSGNQTGQ